jgi:hypothetical protein
MYRTAMAHHPREYSKVLYLKVAAEDRTTRYSFVSIFGSTTIVAEGI